MKNNLAIRALLNSLGVLIYTSLIAAFFFNGEKIFGKADGLRLYDASSHADATRALRCHHRRVGAGQTDFALS